MKSLKFILSALFALMIGTALQADATTTLAVSGVIVGAGYVMPYLVDLPKGLSFMAVSPNVADLNAITAYAGDHKGSLFKRAVFGLEAANVFTVLPNVKDQTPLIDVMSTNGLRPYDSKKQLESELKYGKRTLKTGLGKKELVLDVQKYRNTHLSKYMGRSANDPKIPFAQTANEVIIDGFGSEINDNVPYFGLDKSRFTAFSAAATYAAGDLITHLDTNGNTSYFIALASTSAGEDPLDTPAKWEKINGRAVADGLQIQIEEAITATELTEVTVGQIDNSSVFAIAAFKKVFRSLPAPCRKKVNYALCSYNTFDLLEDDMEEKQKYTVTDPSTGRVMDNAQYVPGTGRKLIAIPCGFMGDSERIIVAQKENLVLGTDLLSDANQININNDLWEREMGLLMNIGFNWVLSDELAINDRD